MAVVVRVVERVAEAKVVDMAAERVAVVTEVAREVVVGG